MTFKKKLIFFLVGFILGVALTAIGGVAFYKAAKSIDISSAKRKIKKLFSGFKTIRAKQVVEDFSKPIAVKNGQSFGKHSQLTFELFRGGIFEINPETKAAVQKSNHYGDVALIRSTKPLPKTYKVSVVVGEIDYGLEKISGLVNDPQYSEGPRNENGCYLLAITDEKPSGHHTNTWWHQHRKVVIDVDNNVWGHGMPNPIFMVYFDENNRLVAFDGTANQWQGEWQKALTYDFQRWYKVEIEKTAREFILRVLSEDGKLLKEAQIDLKKIWHEDEFHEDYFVLGDPHENYYQGSMKIKSIAMPVFP